MRILDDDPALIRKDFEQDSRDRMLRASRVRLSRWPEEHGHAHDKRQPESARGHPDPPACGGFVGRNGLLAAADDFEIDLQVRESFVCGFVSQGLILFGQFLDHAHNVFWDPFEHAANFGEPAIGSGVPHHPGDLTIAAEGIETRKELFEVLAAEQAVGGETERIEIAGWTNFAEVVRDHFGGHVFGRPFEQASFVVAGPAGETEIANLNSFARVDHHIAGLDIAVDDTLFVQMFECPQAVGQRGSESPEIHRLAVETFGEIPLHQFHDQPAAIAVDIENRNDVRMMERCQELGFEPVAGKLTRIFQELLMELLDGDFAPQFDVASAIDGGKAAGADLFENLISLLFARHRTTFREPSGSGT